MFKVRGAAGVAVGVGAAGSEVGVAVRVFPPQAVKKTSAAHKAPKMSAE